ncbi:MAG TPA: DUF1599 domain-containing protein [Saprospiraceae bacterium]|mgnify:CR=1 FL=1|nr:DUF1599 domain-containing protein [Saprospiraceae bacterium]HMQ83167.1 DUF1599 domain-containing protein [Saprospiraceae bacterium]
MQRTLSQYDEVIGTCRGIFEQKAHDYGTAWRILRLTSLTDQMLIKAGRIRSIEEKGKQRIAEGVASEFIGLINYCIIALIQAGLPEDTPLDMPIEESLKLYDQYAAQTKALMEAKNHDYGEIWRQMRVSSMTDLILMKLHRIKQIEDKQGATLISEGVEANYQDIINYAVFALIKMAEQKANT